MVLEASLSDLRGLPLEVDLNEVFLKFLDSALIERETDDDILALRVF